MDVKKLSYNTNNKITSQLDRSPLSSYELNQTLHQLQSNLLAASDPESFHIKRTNNAYLASALFGHNHPLYNPSWGFPKGNLSYNKDGIVQHSKEVSEDRRFKCDNCDKCFTDPSNLQRHIRLHHLGARAHPCPECGKTFATSSGLKQHQHIHSSVKPFTCEVCHKSYTQFSNLCRHKRMHSDCRSKIRCKSCNEKFPNSSSLNKHRRFCESKVLYHASNAFNMCQTLNSRFNTDQSTNESLQEAATISEIKGGSGTEDYKETQHMNYHEPGSLQNLNIFNQSVWNGLFRAGMINNLQKIGKLKTLLQTSSEVPEQTKIQPRVQMVHVQIQCVNPSVDFISHIPSYPSTTFPYYLTTNPQNFVPVDNCNVSYKESVGHMSTQVYNCASDIKSGCLQLSQYHELSQFDKNENITNEGRRDMKIENDYNFNPRALFKTSPLRSMQNMTERYTDIKEERNEEVNPFNRAESESGKYERNIWNPLHSENYVSRKSGQKSTEPIQPVLHNQAIHNAFIQLMIRSQYWNSIFPYAGMLTAHNLRTQEAQQRMTREMERKNVPNEDSLFTMRNKRRRSRDAIPNNGYRDPDEIANQKPTKMSKRLTEEFELSEPCSEINTNAAPLHPLPIRPFPSPHSCMQSKPNAYAFVNEQQVRGEHFHGVGMDHPATNMLREMSNRNENPSFPFSILDKKPYSLNPFTQFDQVKLRQLAINQLRSFGMRSVNYLHPYPNVSVSTARVNGMDNLKLSPSRERYTCKYCGKVFPRSANLTRHLRTHTGEQPYRCKYCDRSFSISSNLQRHVRNIHNKERPYTCNLCGRAFGQQTNLERHLKKHSTAGSVGVGGPVEIVETYSSEMLNSETKSIIPDARVDIDTNDSCYEDVFDSTQEEITPKITNNSLSPTRGNNFSDVSDFEQGGFISSSSSSGNNRVSHNASAESVSWDNNNVKAMQGP